MLVIDARIDDADQRALAAYVQWLRLQQLSAYFRNTEIELGKQLTSSFDAVYAFRASELSEAA